MALVNELLTVLQGEVSVVDCYRLKVSPCIDCKYCYRNRGCSIKDDMTAIYGQIEESDAIVIASPMHFGIVSAPLVTLFSRLQSYWSGRFIRKEKNPGGKYGVLLATSGTQWINMRHLVEGVTDIAFDHMGASQILGSAYAHKTDQHPAKDNRKALARVRELAGQLNDAAGGGR